MDTVKLVIGTIIGYSALAIVEHRSGWASKKSKPEVAEIYSPKTGVRKRIDPQLAHRIEGALNDPMNNCYCDRDQVYNGA